ncbi:hypothetical protein SCLCIDRAFT_357882 [Scleroderma citrinum Foug A]|uniref:Uncharacterized protein n=1 Tax=Scleroderma citrinum Foug A TaxID=1036808 RepID=A0A0C3E094_9AGAM|nr:hypothetical protein SCLCIDRAFT_357882 [Scleroderma citrinum Foug A]
MTIFRKLSRLSLLDFTVRDGMLTERDEFKVYVSQLTKDAPFSARSQLPYVCTAPLRP